MRFLLLTFVVTALFPGGVRGQVQVASLGTCPLELGGAIEECRLGYLTFGELAADRRNAILIPTWFASRAEDWRDLVGPDGIVDTTSAFVIVVESLGAGSSSSPANSIGQPELSFPEITVGDMVEASYRLASEYLDLPELYAVVGISLGGFQAFEWAVSHPEYVRRMVSIEGSPRLGSYDRAMWELAAEAMKALTVDSTTGRAATDDLARLLVLLGSSPAGANRTRSSEYLAAQYRQIAAANMFEWAWHARAVLRQDVSRHFGGDLARAAAQWKGPALVVTAANDHTVTPQPAQEFARLIGADTLVLDGIGGHQSIFSDRAAQAYIRNFLKR